MKKQTSVESIDRPSENELLSHQIDFSALTIGNNNSEDDKKWSKDHF
jgi:hypothetical protein